MTNHEEPSAQLPTFAGTLTHKLPVSGLYGQAAELHYNPTQCLAPDHATLALGRLAGTMLGQRAESRIYEPGVGAGAFLVSTAVSSSSEQTMYLTGDDRDAIAVLTADHNMQLAGQTLGKTLHPEISINNWYADIPQAAQDIIYFNPPYLFPGNSVGRGEAAYAPLYALHDPHTRQGVPRVYAKILPGIYDALAEDGTAIVRLPSVPTEHFGSYIWGIQQQAYADQGIRFTFVEIDAPESTDSSKNWMRGIPGWTPYRRALGMVATRYLPATIQQKMNGNTDDFCNRRVIYQDPSYRITAFADDRTASLIQT